MATYQKLKPHEIVSIIYLRERGASPCFIGKFAQLYYGVTRQAVYRYVSPRRGWYNQKQRAAFIAQIQSLLCTGKNSQQIATSLNEPIHVINRIIVDNHLTVWNCPIKA